MIFRDRADVEYIGRSGVWVVSDELGLRGRQLSRFWLFVDPEDNGYRPHALNDGYWEAWITLWMDHNVRPGSRVLDIGANHGYYSFFLASKGCDVTAVEPQPRLARLLESSEFVNRLGVKIVEAAVSDKDNETVEMMVPIHHGMNATISNQHSYAPDGFETIKVPVFSLDSHEGFDFIKVDAEGAEDLIWAGSKQYRRDFPETLWLMEWRWDRYKNAAKFAKDILSSHDVTFVDFDGVEQPVESVDQLATVKDSDWMLVLRNK